MDPLAHRDLRPEMMFIREELRQAKLQTLAVSSFILPIQLDPYVTNTLLFYLTNYLSSSYLCRDILDRQNVN